MLTIKDLFMGFGIIFFVCIGAMACGYFLAGMADQWLPKIGPIGFLACLVTGAFIAGVGCALK